MNCAQEVETTEKNMITEKVDAVRDKVKRARDNLRVKVHMHMYTLLSRMLLRLLSRIVVEIVVEIAVDMLGSVVAGNQVMWSNAAATATTRRQTRWRPISFHSKPFH